MKHREYGKLNNELHKLYIQSLTEAPRCNASDASAFGNLFGHIICAGSRENEIQATNNFSSQNLNENNENDNNHNHNRNIIDDEESQDSENESSDDIVILGNTIGGIKSKPILNDDDDIQRCGNQRKRKRDEMEEGGESNGDESSDEEQQSPSPPRKKRKKSILDNPKLKQSAKRKAAREQMKQTKAHERNEALVNSLARAINTQVTPQQTEADTNLIKAIENSNNVQRTLVNVLQGLVNNNQMIGDKNNDINVNDTNDNDNDKAENDSNECEEKSEVLETTNDGNVKNYHSNKNLNINNTSKYASSSLLSTFNLPLFHNTTGEEVEDKTYLNIGDEDSWSSCFYSNSDHGPPEFY